MNHYEDTKALMSLIPFHKRSNNHDPRGMADLAWAGVHLGLLTNEEMFGIHAFWMQQPLNIVMVHRREWATRNP